MANRLSSQEVRVKKEHHEYYEQYCRSSGSVEGATEDSPNYRPFTRMVDMWFVAVCLGARHEARSEYTRAGSVKIIEGYILNNEPSKLHMLEMVAMRAEESESLLENPNEVIRICNEYAIGGTPFLTSMLESPAGTPFVQLSRELLSFLQN